MNKKTLATACMLTIASGMTIAATNPTTKDTTSPVISATPQTGVFVTPQTITLLVNDNIDANPRVYYTLDNSLPVASSAKTRRFRGEAIQLKDVYLDDTKPDLVINVLAIDASGNMSRKKLTFLLLTNDLQAPLVTSDIAPGKYIGNQQITLKVSDNRDPNPKLFYTLDGSTPTENSPLYRSGDVILAEDKGTAVDLVINTLTLDVHGNKRTQSFRYGIFPAARLPAFPDAGGFGRYASGGRGGDVVYVTNLNAGGPGSLNWALGYESGQTMRKPRYILFKASGIVSAGKNGQWDAMPHIEYGHFTMAGHTSPGGVILPGLRTDDNKSADALQNMVIRHMRSRPSGVVNGLDDAVRFNRAQNMIVDHCSMAWADDEAMQISFNKDFTVQNSTFSETLGDHWDRGGILIKYHTANLPNSKISFHHNLLNRIGGRLPQVQFDPVQVQQQEMEIDLSYNVMWDPGTTIYFTNFATESQKYYDSWFHANLINNYYHVRPTFTQGMFSHSFVHVKDQLYVKGNRMNIYPAYSDYQLFYGNTDFYKYNPSKGKIGGTKLSQPHNFPTINETPTADLLDYMVENVGAFPRDPMDRRLIGFVDRREIDPTHWRDKGADDGYRFDWQQAPLPPLDSDDDGMPDEWELLNGLDPLVKDHTGKSLSQRYLGSEGYDNLEVYLEMLSRHVITGSALAQDKSVASTPLITRFASITAKPQAGRELELDIQLAASDVSSVQLSLDHLLAPFAAPSPQAIELKGQLVGGKARYKLVVPAERTAGEYQLLLQVTDKQGNKQNQLLPVTLI